MFSYYGSKSKIAKYYPEPKHNTIIEPFAGAAHYSFLYHDKEVILNEKYEVLYDIWHWIINEATEDFIKSNNNFKLGDDIRDYLFPKPYRSLLGFIINRGSSSPCNIVGKWNCQVKSNPNHASTVEFQLNRIADSLSKVKHWEVRLGDYKDIDNIEATWFIDPPYENGGDRYKHSDIDYKHLSSYSRDRKGQVIVCENNDAKWLPFEPLLKTYNQRNFNKELIYTNV